MEEVLVTFYVNKAYGKTSVEYRNIKTIQVTKTVVSHCTQL